MKGDFTRFSHQPDRTYAAVLMQQGRVTLDADWNEAVEIEDHRWRVQTVDTIGRACAPVDAAGFGLSFTPDGRDLVIGEGRIYVDGILVEHRHGSWVAATLVDERTLAPADMAPGGRAWAAGQWVELAWTEDGGDRSALGRIEEVDAESVVVAVSGDGPGDAPADLRVRRLTTYLTQPFFPAAADPPFGDPFTPEDWEGQRHLLYLDVWRRHVTAVEDPGIREVALGGPDTATRVQTAWAVRVLFTGDDRATPFDAANVGCTDRIDRWDELTAPAAGRMSARAEAAPDPEDPCLVAPGAGYRGLENRLYRVEIHDPGPLGVAAFKWSRDNGSILSAIVDFPAADEIEVHSLGRDAVLRFRADDRVEVLSDESELSGQPGTMAAVVGQPDEARRRLALDTDVSLYQDHQRPRARRWDEPADLVATSSGWTELEDGVQVRFSGGPFRAGDYWVVPARVATGDVEGFTDRPPRGVEHHLARLALVSWSSRIDDCRHTFRPLCDLPSGGGEGCATATVGDGTTSVGDFTDIQAAIDSVPAEGPGRVTVLPGTYLLRDPLVVRHRRFTLAGCGSQTRLVAAAGAGVVRVEGSSQVRLEWLTMESRADDGTVTVEASSDVTVERCTVVNGVRQQEDGDGFLDAAVAPAGPAILVGHSAQARLLSNRLLGAPAASVQAAGAVVAANTVRGTVWARDGSREVVVRGNDIVGGTGPGVALGGLGPGERPSRRLTGVRSVEVAHNRIVGMAGSGVTTVSLRPPAPDLAGLDVLTADLRPRRPADFDSLVASFGAPRERIAATDYVAVPEAGVVRAVGDVADVRISDNLIAECGRAGADPGFDAEAVGGVVLREVIRPTVHRNEVVRCGRRACGVFLHGCEEAEVTDNRIAGNGRAGGRFVDFTATGRFAGPNPLEVDGFVVRLAGTETSRVVPLIGLLVPRRADVTLPAETDAVQLTVLSPGGARAVALDAAGEEVASQELDDGLQAAVLEGAGIASLRLEPAGDERGAVLVSVCAGRECRTYQGGIVGVGLSPTAGGGAFAARVHDNAVSAPAGQALLLTGVGAMSVQDNNLVSLGRTLQAGAVREFLGERLAVEHLSRAVHISNAGTVPEFGNRAGLPLPPTIGRFGGGAGPDGPDGLDGRTLFCGNQVAYRPRQRDDEPEAVLASVGIASFDDVAVLGNQLAVEGAHTLTVSDLVAMAVTVRAADNRCSEPLNRALWSASVVGFWVAQAIGNQATHCISVNGVLGEVVANQVLVEHLTDVRCDDRRFNVGAVVSGFTFGEG